MSRPKHPKKEIEEAIKYAEEQGWFQKMKNYIFTLVLEKTALDKNKIEDALYEAGCDDALLSFYGDIPHLDFDRKAVSLEESIRLATEDVSLTGLLVLEIKMTSKEFSLLQH